MLDLFYFKVQSSNEPAAQSIKKPASQISKTKVQIWHRHAI